MGWAISNIVKKQNTDRQGNGANRSRREFLKKTSLFMVGGVILGATAGKYAFSRLARRRRAPVVPQGSIFTPAVGRNDTV